MWFSKEVIEAGIAPGGFAMRLRGERHARRRENYTAGDWADALAGLEAMLASHRSAGGRIRIPRKSRRITRR